MCFRLPWHCGYSAKSMLKRYTVLLIDSDAVILVQSICIMTALYWLKPSYCKRSLLLATGGRTSQFIVCIICTHKVFVQ